MSAKHYALLLALLVAATLLCAEPTPSASKSNSGTAANGFGTAIELGAEASDGTKYAQTVINSIWTDATAATRSSALTFMTRNNAGALTEQVRIDRAGNVGIGTNAPSSLLHVGKAGTTLGTIGLAGNTSGLVTVQPAAAAGTWTMTLPTNDGDAGQFLQTDGSGTTSWAASSGMSTSDYTQALLLGGM